MTTAENIRRLRRAARMSMESLGEHLGVSRQTVFRYENGTIVNIPRDKLEKMAELFGVPIAELYGFGGSIFDMPGILPVERRRVPLLGDIACGTPIYADEQHENFVAVGTGEDVDFCLRAKGDSMIGARILDGDYVFVRAQDAVDNGEIAVVIIGDEATLKRVYYYPEKQKLILTPENPAYEPLVYIGEELEQIKILGKAVAFQSALR